MCAVASCIAGCYGGRPAIGGGLAVGLGKSRETYTSFHVIWQKYRVLLSIKAAVFWALSCICLISSCCCVCEAAHSALVACKLATEPSSSTTLSLKDW